MYKISCGSACELEDACTIEMDNGTVYHLSAKAWNAVITAGLKAGGLYPGRTDPKPWMCQSLRLRQLRSRMGGRLWIKTNKPAARRIYIFIKYTGGQPEGVSDMTLLDAKEGQGIYHKRYRRRR